MLSKVMKVFLNAHLFAWFCMSLIVLIQPSLSRRIAPFCPYEETAAEYAVANAQEYCAIYEKYQAHMKHDLSPLEMIALSCTYLHNCRNQQR